MKRCIEVLNWDQVREEVTAVNPELAKVIDPLSPGKEFTLYKTSYIFGDKLINNGLLQLPDESGSQLLAVDDDRIPSSYKQDLLYNYNSNPATLVLDNSLELYLLFPERIVPYSFMKPGNLFGLWRLLDPAASHCMISFFWEMTAGARSLYMLPKVSESLKFHKLKREFNIGRGKPDSLPDQWEIFRVIGNEVNTKPAWKTTVLYFSKPWFDHLQDPAWQQFHNYLMHSAWRSSSFWRNEFLWDMIFNHIQARHNIKTTAYIAGLAKSLLMLAVGVVPAFKPATSDIAGPVSHIQQAYADIYGLKQYAPTIMQPDLFSMFSGNDRAYLSLITPTALEIAPKTNPQANIIKDLVSLQSLLRIYLEQIAEGNLNVGGSLINEVPALVNFDFFHNQAADYRNILPSAEIPQDDPRFHLGNNYSQIIATDGPFLRACVRLMTN